MNGYKAGDAVVIRKPSGGKDEIKKIGPGWYPHMDNYDGRIVTLTDEMIESSDEESVYIEEYYILWDWIEPLIDEPEETIDTEYNICELLG